MDFFSFSAIYAVIEVLGILSAIHSIMRTRSSQGAIAWSFGLVLFPLVSLPLYWIFGRNKFEGYVITRQRGDLEIQERVMKGLMPFEDSFGAELEGETARFQICEKLAQLPFTKFNTARLLIDGPATFDAILASISQAKTYVLIQFFIIHDDEIGRQLKEAVMERAKTGVRVYLLYDEIGSRSLPQRYLDELTEVGVNVSAFHTSRGFTHRFQLNFRNHRKIVIVDGERGFVGGHNVGDEYLGRDPQFGHWRDTHLELVGPSVQCLQLPFVEDWYWANGELPPTMNWEVTKGEEPGEDILIIPTGPADSRTSCSLMFLHLINSAKQRCWITSPYYVPNDEVAAALELAVLRGVDVRVLVPDKVDHLLVYLSSFSFIEQGLSAGIRFFRYETGFLHQKVILVDDDLACVGTANLDNRSMRLNFEITAAVSDPNFSHEIEHMLREDFKNSREMKVGELSRKSFLFQLACQTSRLMAPIQ